MTQVTATTPKSLSKLHNQISSCRPKRNSLAFIENSVDTKTSMLLEPSCKGEIEKSLRKPIQFESQSSVVSESSTSSLNLLQAREKQQQSKRFVWPKELHRDFVSSIFSLGLERCTPLSILLQINGSGSSVTIEEVSSYLETYKRHLQSHVRPDLELIRASVPPTSVEVEKLTENEETRNGGLERISVSISNKSACSTKESGWMPASMDSESSAVESDYSHRSRNFELLKGSSDRCVKNDDKPLKNKCSSSEEKNAPKLGYLVLPSLTEAEKNSSIGASMVFLMGLYYSLEQELQTKRISETNESKIVSKPSCSEVAVDDNDQKTAKSYKIKSDTQTTFSCPDDGNYENKKEINDPVQCMVKCVSQLNQFILSENKAGLDHPNRALSATSEKACTSVKIDSTTYTETWPVVQGTFQKLVQQQDYLCKKRAAQDSDDTYRSKRSKYSFQQKDSDTDEYRFEQLSDPTPTFCRKLSVNPEHHSSPLDKPVQENTGYFNNNRQNDDIQTSSIFDAQMKRIKSYARDSSLQTKTYRELTNGDYSTTRYLTSRKGSVTSEFNTVLQEQYLPNHENPDFDSLHREDLGSIADVSDFEDTKCDDEDTHSFTSSASHKTCRTLEECTDMDADTIYRYLLEDST